MYVLNNYFSFHILYDKNIDILMCIFIIKSLNVHI